MFGRSKRNTDDCRPAAPVFETLENRQLLSASINFSGGVLSVQGTSGADSISFERTGTNLDRLRARVNGLSRTVRLADVSSIRVSALAGNDRVHFDDERAQVVKTTTIDAGDGNDRVDGSGGNDTILGGNGNDRLDGKRGNDRLDGGAGNDVLNAGSGNDTVLGGSGNDDLDGGAGNDRLEGGTGDDDLNGKAGTDTIFGNAGNDDFLGLDDHPGADDDARSEVKDLLREDSGANTNPGGNGTEDNRGGNDDRGGNSGSGRGGADDGPNHT